MKQLVHSSGPFVVAALNDRAYAVAKNCDDGNSFAVELLPPTVCSTKDRSGQDDGGVEAKDNQPSDNAVQAVVSMLTNNGSTLLCAVSRHDKTLSLHSLSVSESTIKSQSPLTVHKLVKRACCLAMTEIEGVDEVPVENIIIAGDLAGDATAYPTLKSDKTNCKLGASRLLLGHTASMLTGVRIVTDNGRPRILTSDRDEKVRVSLFPQTFIVEGYLLGHTAFISSLDVALDDGCTHCVTSGGDGTVRLWDYTCFKELAILPPLPKGAVRNSDNDHSGTVEVEKEEDAKCSGIEDQAVIIPTASAISHDGKIVAVVYDEMDSVDIYAVGTEDDQFAFNKRQSIKCPSQPLSVSFLPDGSLCVLTRDPTFMVMYQTKSNNTDGNLYAPIKSSVGSALREIGNREKISMPMTILETDQRGQIKLSKDKEKGISKNEPWNRVERKEKAKIRNSRRKRKKAEEKKLQDQK